MTHAIDASRPHRAAPPGPRQPVEEAAPRAALLVAHGSPSAPEVPERAMRALAHAVEAQLGAPWQVIGTTLGAPDGLDEAAEALRARPGPMSVLVYPHFMADGWFVREEVPRRLAAAGIGPATAGDATSGADDVRLLAPFGHDPRLPALCRRRAREAARSLGRAPGELTLLLAAHGSPRNPRPGELARLLAKAIGRDTPFREVRLGFVDEDPRLAAVAQGAGPGLCLPLFAGRAHHVDVDLPEALETAGFEGPLLDPVGADAHVPEMIAAALAAAAQECRAAQA